MARDLNRRDFLMSLGASFAGRRPPNLLFILADDLGYGDPGCYNKNSKIPTPALDRLASQGVHFTDAHSPSAVCTPTRYGILTGRYCWRTWHKSRVLQADSKALIEPGRLTLAAMLRKQGYRTACIGKWHLGWGEKDKADFHGPVRPAPTDNGFDYFFGIPGALDQAPYLYIENDRAVEKPTGTIAGIRKYERTYIREGAIAPGFKHVDVLPTLTARTVQWLQEHARQSPKDPFFLFYSLTGPHTPWVPAPQFQGRSKAGDYGDFVTQVDDSVSQVLKAVDALRLRQETLVIFTSDNGAHWLPEEIAQYGHRANYPLRGQKADIYEGGHRVPFLARWPGKIRPGSTSRETICLVDLLPTMAEITGVKLPDDASEDGYSVLPALLGKKLPRPIREATVLHSYTGHFAIRKGDWKLHLGRGSGGFTPPVEYAPQPGEPAGELYNLARDPGETTNLYTARPDVVKDLEELLKKYEQQGYSRPRAS